MRFSSSLSFFSLTRSSLRPSASVDRPGFGVVGGWATAAAAAAWFAPTNR